MRTRLALPVAATAVSAFLLFTLELYAGRVVLPVFGGSPAVWTTALCFFTTVVFLGYLYAHLLITRATWRLARWIHLVLVVAALAAAAFAPHALLALRGRSLVHRHALDALAAVLDRVGQHLRVGLHPGGVVEVAADLGHERLVGAVDGGVADRRQCLHSDAILLQGVRP